MFGTEKVAEEKVSRPYVNTHPPPPKKNNFYQELTSTQKIYLIVGPSFNYSLYVEP